jgi:CheY-like chemotaxis protein
MVCYQRRSKNFSTRFRDKNYCPDETREHIQLTKAVNYFPSIIWINSYLWLKLADKIIVMNAVKETLTGSRLLEHFSKIQAVMVIDDIEEDIYYLERMLTKHGFCRSVISFKSGIEALAYLQKHISNKNAWPEIIFLDLAMPELSGEEFLQHFNSFPTGLKQKCSIYVYSSSTLDEEIYMNRRHPLVAGFIPKPINLIYLLGVLSEHQRFGHEC